MHAISRMAYTESFDNGVHVYTFTGKCQMTGKPYSVTVPGSGLYRYNQGALIQDAFPDLSAGDREFLMSGTSPEGWEKLFPTNPNENK